MNTYIALFRGINVSGQKKIKMADLRQHMQALGFDQVRTYIQSGNLIFQSEVVAKDELEKQIEEKILAEYGFEVSVIIRTPEELQAILVENPFLQNPENDPKRFYVAVLASEPTTERLDVLAEKDYAPEAYAILGKTLYFYVPNGYGRSKMNNNFFENKLKVVATTRNWRTMHKLAEMAAE